MKHLFIITCVLLLHGSARSQDLQTLIDIGLENNPEIKKINLSHDIAEEKVREVSNVPNTEFSYGYYVSEPETRTGAQKMKFSIKQMIPWFGSITARENYAASLTDAQFEEIVIAKRKLIVSVSNSYYKLYALKEKKQLIDENLKLIEVFETMALSSVENGKVSAVSVLRLQMRQNELRELRGVLEHDYRNESASLNGFLNRDPAIEIVVTQELPMPEEDQDINRTELQMHPELLKYDRLYASVEQHEALNQKEKSPMIGFGLDYIPVEKRANMDFADNGKDVVMPMVSLSLPIFNKKYKSNTRQNELRLLEIEAGKKEQYLQLQRMLDHAVHGRRGARYSYNIQLKNIEHARQAEKILLKTYETGTADFDEVLEVQELQLKFQLGLVEALKDYYVQTTTINYLSNQQ